MSEENKVVEEVTANDEFNETQEQETVQEEAVTDSEVDPIEREVQERLAKMKSNMDRMAGERDEALKKAAEVEQKQKQALSKKLLKLNKSKNKPIFNGWKKKVNCKRF
jgi:hypothetical protein